MRQKGGVANMDRASFTSRSSRDVLPYKMYLFFTCAKYLYISMYIYTYVYMYTKKMKVCIE